MPGAIRPSQEKNRLQILRDLAILDTPAEPALDQITEHLAQLLKVPITSVSLVDEDRQWFKSCFGLSEQETPREASFCAHTILSDQVLVIEDATKDERTRDNPLVTGPPYIQAYIGYPLHIRGENIGSLCGIDVEPRQFTPRDIDLLTLAGKWVEREIELRDRTSLAEARDLAAKRAHDLFHHAPLPLISVSSDGAVGELNQAAERLWESIGEGLLRDHLSVGRIGDSTIEAILEQVRRAGFLSSLDPLRLETPEGGAFYLQPAVVADPNSENGLLLGFIDQTELVLASRAWTDATGRERLARSEAIVEERQFMARLSHEMRNAVNGMVGFIDLWKNDQATPTREQMDLLESCVTTLKGLVDDTLDYDQIQRGGISFERHPFDLQRLCADLVTSTEVSAQVKGLTLEHHFELGSGYFMGDELRVRQILTNVLSNSVKYTETGEIKFQASRQDDAVVFTIADSGRGMSPEFQEVVFEPYSQARGTFGGSSAGVGLGLAIVGELVRQMEGSIDLHSRIGRGSTFTVTLPLSETQPHTRTEPIDELPRLENLHVLVVDDNAVNRVVMSAQLRHLGCRVALAQDGLEALEYLAEHQPAVVLLDCHMPRLDGFETARRICSSPDRYGEPILVALTASVDVQAEEKCRAAGMRDFMQKPLRFVELYQRLKDITET